MSRPTVVLRPLAALLFAAALAACVDEQPIAPDRIARVSDDEPAGFAFDSVRSIVGGEYHACALDVGGVAYCWGHNGGGQLGRPSSETCSGAPCSTRPVLVRGDRTWTHLAAGLVHTCGVEAGTGHVYCWGNGSFGQLGIGAPITNTTLPQRVAAPGTFQTVTAGTYHTCALATDRRIWCWGDNDWGQASGDSAMYLSPRLVPPARTYSQVSAGRLHTCAIAFNGSAYCWGLNDQGQVGDTAAGQFVTSPTPVNGPGSWVWISGGGYHTCGLRGATRIPYCWGDNGALQAGHSGPTGATPTRVETTRRFQTIAAGDAHTCGLEVTSNRITCWGYNAQGQLARGDSAIVYGPGRIPGPRVYGTLAAGSRFGGCATAAPDDVWCWGNGSYGSLAATPDTLGTCYTTPCAITPRRIRSAVVFEYP